MWKSVVILNLSDSLLINKLWKESLNSDGPQFQQYQQNEQSPFISTYWMLLSVMINRFNPFCLILSFFFVFPTRTSVLIFQLDTCNVYFFSDLVCAIYQIVSAWNKGLHLDMSLHSETLPKEWDNTYLLLLLNTAKSKLEHTVLSLSKVVFAVTP